MKVKVTQSCPTLCDPMECSLPGSSVHGILQARILEWVASCSLLQWIFPTQGLNPALPHCRWILYHLSHQGSPIKLDWAAYPFSRGSSWPRDWTRSPALQAYSLPAELPEKPSMLLEHQKRKQASTEFYNPEMNQIIYGQLIYN